MNRICEKCGYEGVAYYGCFGCEQIASRTLVCSWPSGSPDPNQLALDQEAEASDNEVRWGCEHPECLDSAEDFAQDDL